MVWAGRPGYTVSGLPHVFSHQASSHPLEGKSRMWKALGEEGNGQDWSHTFPNWAWDCRWAAAKVWVFSMLQVSCL